MATVNPSMIRAGKVRLAIAETLDAIPQQHGTFAVVGGSLYAYDGDELIEFGAGTAIDRPALGSAILDADGVSFALKFLGDIVSADPAGGFTLLVDDEPVLPVSGSVSGDEISMTVPLIYKDQAVSLAYAGGDIKSVGGLSLLPLTIAVQNDSAIDRLLLVGALLKTDGVTLVATFSENIASADATQGFAVLVDGDPVAISAATVLDDTITFTVDEILPEQVVTLAYAEGDVAADATNAPLDAFEDAPVDHEEPDEP